MKCTPKISNEAAQLLQNYYIKDRRDVKNNKTSSKKKNSIPVTVRQLEAIIRLSEAIAKMGLCTVVTQNHVIEAHRLFQVSTLSTAQSGSQYSIPTELIPQIKKIEEALKRRFPIGQKVAYSKVMEMMNSFNSNSKAIDFAILNLVKSDEFEYSEQRKMIIRKK